jgi:iron complex transport system substrate-binding protein
MRVRLKSRMLSFAGLGIAVVLALAGCSAGSGGTAGPSASGAATSQQRTVTDVVGDTVQLPANPQRVVALDEPATLNLLAMGIRPAAAFQAWKTVVPAEVMKSAGLDVRTTAGYYPKLEEVAALNPDLIVISTSADRANELPDYASIAPTLRAVFNAQPAELARTWGGYFGHPERAKVADEALATFAAEVAGEQPDPAPSLSALESYGGSGDTSLHYMGAENALHDIIAGAGFDRPRLQNEESAEGQKYGGWIPFSPETLPNHDADIIAIKSSPQFDPKGVTGLPLFGSLKGRAVEVDGDFWSGGSLFYAYWVLCDLRDFAAGELAAGGSDDATERWQAFTAMTGKS